LDKNEQKRKNDQKMIKKMIKKQEAAL